MKRLLFLLCLLSTTLLQGNDPKRIYTFPIREDIMPSIERLTAKCMKAAEEQNADLVVIQMNTYGGLVNVADSVRTTLLNAPMPVWVFIDNQAASAGALIALAADSVYMRPGGSIGAASVVNNNGEVMPEKFQSFMRSTMRATAEAHGKVIESIRGEDTLWRWRRDPAIAEAMVGTPGDSSRVLTLTAEEAILRGYSEGTASSVDEVLRLAGIQDYTLVEYHPSGLDRLLGWLMNPVVQGIFIMMMIGGIYFELQTPGIGFPLLVAISGALLYFAPLYLEGVAQNWEILLFVIGLILIGVEIFVLPGFGVAGIVGGITLIIGLTFAAIDNALFRYISSGEVALADILLPFLMVIISCTIGLLGALWLSRRFLTRESLLQRKVVLTTELRSEDGFSGHVMLSQTLIGKQATVSAVLHPTGRLLIGETYYDGVAENGFYIPAGTQVRITRIAGGQLYCKPLEE